MTLSSPALAYPPRAQLRLAAAALARTVSDVCSPPVLCMACVAVCAASLATPAAWVWAGLHVLLGILLPTAYLLHLVHTGRVSDRHLRLRHERLRPLLVFLGGHGVSLALHLTWGAPRLLVLVVVCSLVQLALFLAITVHWQISMHCTAAAGLAMLGGGLLGAASLLLLWAAVPLVAWSRLHLERHTPMQTVAGTAMGACMWLLALQALGG